MGVSCTKWLPKPSVQDPFVNIESKKAPWGLLGALLFDIPQSPFLSTLHCYRNSKYWSLNWNSTLLQTWTLCKSRNWPSCKHVFFLINGPWYDYMVFLSWPHTICLSSQALFMGERWNHACRSVWASASQRLNIRVTEDGCRPERWRISRNNNRHTR